jgi:NAD(P)-dependent dehydrogenase (short-subunit alcohol dehydrogenase family)
MITGGGRGIGAATARLAAQRGYAVCINYLRDEAAAQAVVQDIARAGGRAAAVRGDVAAEQDVVRMFAECDRALGRLTALVNNAGVVDRQMRVEAMDAARLQRMFSINVIGAFLCAREAIRRMSTRHGGQGGAIVNVSSAASRIGSPGEYVDYAAAKGAIDTMTLGLAKELAGDGIRVNCVRPGFVHTETEEVARAVLWLLSDEASYSTGAILDVTGGR